MKNTDTKKRILIVLFLGLFLSGCIEGESKAEKDCPDIMKYKVGDYVFGLPRDSDYVREYTALNQPLSRSERPCDEVMDLIAFTYGPNEFSKYKKDRGSILNISISMQRPEAPSSDTYTFRNVVKKLEAANLTLNDLPKEDGFYVFEFKGNQFLFIADSNELKTKLGNPLTFYCSPNNYNKNYLLCGSGFAWQDNLYLGVTLNTQRFPVSSWSELYIELQKFAENLITEEIEKRE